MRNEQASMADSDSAPNCLSSGFCDDAAPAMVGLREDGAAIV